MERIATALGVTLGHFFNHTEASRGSVVRHNDRPCLNLDWSLAEIESAGALDSGSQLYAFLVKIRAGGLSGKHPRPSTNDEFAFVYHGEVNLTLGATDHILVPGDSAVIPAGVNRRWRNESSEPAQILIVSAKAHI
jgi:quercetin dioxygenase-like cupin family protein